MISKIILFPISALSQTLSLVIQATVVALSMIADLLKEKESRKIFKRFYDYRESHTKFRDLMVSGLPTSLLILSRDLKHKLFSNQCLEDTVSQETIQQGKVSIVALLDWLSHIQIDHKSFKKESTSPISTGVSEPPMVSVLDLLKGVDKQKIDLFKMTFNVEYIKDPSQPKKIYEINISSTVWDTQDSIAIILNDVTALFLNQSLKIADSNKDKMLAMISHELRTPLNGILGVVRILEKQTKDSQTLQYLTICKNSGELLYNLVNSILDLQQIRDDKFSLKMSKLDLHELVNDVYCLFRFQFEEKGLYLNLEIGPEVPQFIVTDHNRLRQILINLVGNALKFTYEGGVNVSVGLDLEQQDCISFCVKDTGIGVKEEDKEKLFKMYGRLDQPDMKTNTQGVGFGLEISNQLAQLLADGANNSRIKFTSESGKGSSFSFLVKDKNHNSKGSSEIDFFDHHAFDEDIENLSLKLCPYSSHSALSSEIELTKGLHTPPRLKPRKRNSSYLLSAPKIPNLRSSSRAQSYIRSPNMQITTKSKNNENYTFNLMRPDGVERSRLPSFHLPNKSERDFLYSPESVKNSGSEKEQEHAMKNVLIIDDNSFNLLVAKHLVEGLGYMVKTALNGKLGVELIKSISPTNKRPFDVILMDLQMPVMDGYEATRVLKKMMASEEIADIPIVALSANDSEDDKARCREVGMYAHLSKPLKEAQFKKILGEVCCGADLSLGSLDEID